MLREQVLREWNNLKTKLQTKKAEDEKMISKLNSKARYMGIILNHIIDLAKKKAIENPELVSFAHELEVIIKDQLNFLKKLYP